MTKTAKHYIIRESINDRIFTAVCYCIATFFMLLILYPLIFILSASVSDPNLVGAGKVWLWPKGLTFEGYVRIFEDKNIMMGYGNTIFYTFFGTLINLVFTLTCGYAISKKTLPGLTGIIIFLMIPMYFNGGLIPTYLFVTRQLNLGDTRAILLVIGAVGIWNLMIARAFFVSFPAELEEAATIDGCSVYRMFLTIVLPLSKAVISVLLLYYAVSHWNSYFSALVYIRDDTKMPLQIFLRRILITEENMLEVGLLDAERTKRAQQLRMLIKFSVIIVSSLPVLVLYPFIQKYFDKGVMLGSLKG